MSSIADNRVEVMHGVNLDMLGKRSEEHYGDLTLTDLELQIEKWARELGLEVIFFQTNHEGEYVEQIHRLSEGADGAILNPGAWTHYSYAIHDAAEIAGVPFVEVHLSDVQAREEWRARSIINDIAIATISGKGPEGYKEALGLLARELEER